MSFKRPDLQINSYQRRVLEGKGYEYPEKVPGSVVQKVKKEDNIKDLHKDLIKLGKKLGERLGIRLGENQIKIIYFMKKDKFITIIKLADKLNISTTAVENNIKKLSKLGIIKRIGTARGGHWKILK